MPVNPQVAAILDEMALLGGKALEVSTPAEARAGDWSRDYVGPTEQVKSVVHTFIQGPTADLPVRIYTPDVAEPLAVIAYFHGSAFAVSNIGLADSPHRSIANRTGCVVVAVNYQKAPEHKFPTPLDDAFAATEWVAANAVALGVPSGRVAVGGDSAGANLAAAVCLRARAENGPSLSLQLLIYPALDAECSFPSMTDNAEGYMLTAAGVRWAWEQYLASPADAANPLASPMKAVDLTQLPPAIVLTAEYDPLRDEGEAFADRLSAAGVSTTTRRYDGMIHGFLWTAGVVDGSKRLLTDIGRDVRALLGRNTDSALTPSAAPSAEARA